LAWIPYGLSEAILSKKRKNLFFIGLLFFSWFIFYPNSLYIVTDLIHLGIKRDAAPLWFDFIMISVFSWTGILLGFFSLHSFQQWIQKKFGKIQGWLLVGVMIFLSSFAIYLGRFLRWNSWDILANPHKLLTDVLELFIHFGSYAEVWLFCFTVGVIFLGAYSWFYHSWKVIKRPD
jgi:uncharacterized membrane protein